jgi:hypothetical protein
MDNERTHPSTARWWCQGLSQEGLDACFISGHGLVLIDHRPSIEGEAGAWLRQRIKGPGGVHATPVDEPRHHAMEGLRPNETLLHAVHGGLDGGAAVVVDQYLLLQDGEPTLLVRLITPVNGPMPIEKALHDDLLLKLLGRATPKDDHHAAP